MPPGVEPSGGSSCEAGRALTAKRLTATQDVAVFSEFLEWLQNGQRGRFTVRPRCVPRICIYYSASIVCLLVFAGTVDCN